MKGKLEKQGQYELFETTKSHQILTLDQKQWYAIVEGKQGDILVLSDADHEKKKTLMKGDFYLANFKDDPEFNNVPHLFLQDKSFFREFILPNGLPTKSDYQKKLIRTDEKLPNDKIKEHVDA